jgi:pathogenesis-related protein 1
MIVIAHRLFLTVASLFVAISFIPHASAHMQKKHATRGLWDTYQYLSSHNTIRVEHGATPLTWSTALAEAAESWVQSCSFSHSSGVLSDGTAYGENMVAGPGEVSIQTAVNSFVSDESSFTFQPETYNHFSQVVWKATTEVGCATYTQCSGIFDSTRSDETLVACFYSPPGNVIGALADNVQL